MTDLRQAAQQALDALERYQVKRQDFDRFADEITALKAALEQQAKPVAWMDRDGDVYPMPENKKWAPPHVLLYTTPPQRQWVGLTDEEIHRTTVLLGFNPEWKTEIGVAHAIVRNLEAKLKERNND